jgi:hypothetical protein
MCMHNNVCVYIVQCRLKPAYVKVYFHCVGSLAKADCICCEAGNNNDTLTEIAIAKIRPIELGPSVKAKNASEICVIKDGIIIMQQTLQNIMCTCTNI